MSVTVITGAGGGGGMGLACVEAFSETSLLLVDISEEALASALAITPNAETAVADLGASNAIAALARRIDDLGGLRSLIHLAGISPSMGDPDRVLQVDLVGTATLIDALLPTARPGTVAVCAASIAAHLVAVSEQVDSVLDQPLVPDLRGRLEDALGTPLDAGLAYSLAKRGVIRLCERAAASWGTRGARIISVSPGLIDTPMGRLELRDNPAKLRLVGRTPAGPPEDDGSPDLPGRRQDISEAIAFLVGPQARFITGCDLRVDGGLVGALRFAALAERGSKQ
jgi:NAD(P)-dependent dehydrogenase (short-subunit alcohol dehydrogenase family)